MKKPFVIAAGRMFSRLRWWLRHIWISRVAVLDCLTDDHLPYWLPFRSAGDRPSRLLRRSRKPDFEIFESRETANDVLSILGTSVVASGLGVLTGDLATPATVLLRGWAAGRRGPLHSDIAVVSRDRTDTPFVAVMHSGPAPMLAPAPSSRLGREIAPVLPTTIPTIPSSSSNLIAAAETLRNPLGDDWLNALSAVLNTPPQHNGDAPPDTPHPGTIGGENAASGTSQATVPASVPSTPVPSSSDRTPPAQNLAALAGLPTFAPVAPISTSPGRAPALGGTGGAGGATPPGTTAPPAAPGGNAPLLQDVSVNSQPTFLDPFGRTALPFEANVGQTDPSVALLSRGPGFGLFLTPTAATLALVRPGQDAPPDQILRDVVQLQFAGAATSPQIFGQNELTSRSNYFTGSDATAWHADVPQYGQALYQNLYPGIDLQWYGTSTQQLEYTFVINPGADPSNVRLSWQGVQGLSLDKQGNLMLRTGGASLVQQAPVLYQMVNGARQSVSGRQILNQDGTVSFQVDSYDATLPLCIDPVLSFATYLGGSGDDKGYAIATDLAGDTYVTGSTLSSSFPGTVGSSYAGAGDAFVAKLSASGSGLAWSTYLGGSAADQGNGIAVDPSGNAYIVGTTSSSNFPTTTGAYKTSYGSGGVAFVSKVSISGDALLYSTYLGNTSVTGTAISIDRGGDAFVTGSITSATGSSFPTTTGAYETSPGGGNEAFATELNPTATALVWSTFLGGSGNDAGNGIALDSSGNAYVTGTTTGSFPTTTGAYLTTAPNSNTAFITKVNSGGASLGYSTYLGGSATGPDVSNAIAVDSSGDAFVTGKTQSNNFPTTTGAYQTTFGGGTASAFVTKLNAAGSGLVYSTYLQGGSSGAVDQGYGIAVDSAGYATVTGATNSTNFPTTTGAFQSSYGGGLGSPNDAFVTRLLTDGSGLSYSSYLGGSGEDQGRGVALDALGNAYIAGFTKSTNFPTGGVPYQSSNAGGYDAFVSKVGLNPPAPIFQNISTDTGVSFSDQITNSQNLTLSGTAVPGSTVTISRADLGTLGSVSADPTTGAWTFDYTGTTLPEGTYAFTGTTTSGGLTSAPSKPFLVAVDLTAPTVTLVAPASTTSKGPQVRVLASDLIGLPNDTSNTLYYVSVDVDLNHNGTFDTGELNYATGALHDGFASFTLAALPGLATYAMRARVRDLAGNIGTSATQNVQVVAASPWNVTAQSLTADPLDGQADLQLGDVSVQQPLDLDRSPGTQQGGNPALVYHSDSVSQLPVIQVTVPTDNAVSMPTTITVQLTWNLGPSQTVNTSTFMTGGAAPGTVLTVGIQPSAAVTTTGRYPWSVQVTINTTPQTVRTVTGYTFVDAQDSSAFGAGWTLASVDRLVSIPVDSTNGYPAGMLRLYGSGGFRFYSGTTSFTSPTGDNGTLSLSGSTYTYSTPDGQQWQFNSNGYETSWTSADGQQTLQYRYDGSNRLSGVTAIDGGLSTFTYSGSLLSTIQTVNNRTTTLAFTGTNLTSITNPDGGVHTFSYDSNHRATGETIGGLQDVWSYASNGTLSTFTWGSATSGGLSNPDVTIYRPVAAQVLISPATVGTVFAKLTDPNNHVTLEQLDGQGRPLQQVAGDGGLTVWTRDSNGRVVTQTDPLSRVTTFTRDSLGYVTQETFPDGNSISYGYQSAFHALTTVTNERGYNTTYSYDSNGHLIRETNALTQTTTFGWTASGLLQAVTDALNHTTTLSYDATTRRLTTQTDPLGDVTSFTYDVNGNLLTMTDPLGRITTLTEDALGRLTQQQDALNNLTTWTYSAAGLQLTSLDPLSRLTSTVYDSFNRGLVYRNIEAVGTSVQRSTGSLFDNAGQIKAGSTADGFWKNIGYDPVGRQVQTTDFFGNTARQVYDRAGQLLASRDELGRWTQYQYNLRGWLTQVTDALGDVTTISYDASGNETAVTDPLSHTTTYQYDQLNRQTVVTDPLNHSVTTIFDAAGNVATVTDQNGHVTSYAYDVANRQTTTTQAIGSTVQRTTTVAYDKDSNVIAQTDALGHTFTYTYDSLNRQIAVTDPLNHTTTTAYDAVGNVTMVQDALGKITAYSYDAINRVTQVTDPLNHTATTLYDAVGNVVGTVDALGDTTLAAFDALGRHILTADARGGLAQGLYDAVGNQVALIDPVGNQTNFSYDGLNREILQTDALGRSVTVVYDGASRITSITDRDGRQQVFSYDSADRLMGDIWKDGTGTTVNTQTFTYDATGNLLTAADHTGAITQTYDALDRLQTNQNVFGITLTYVLDLADRRQQVQDSLGGVTSSVYDAANRLTSRQFGGTGQTPLRMDLGYDNRDELTSLSRYSDLAGTQSVGTTVYSYDDAGRVSSIVTKNSSAATLSYYNYSYDSADRVTAETWQSGSTPGSHSYSYGSTNQLTNDGTTTYSYDLNGNRTMTGYQTGTDNRLSTDGVWTYTYDNEGNLTQKSKGSGLETWYYSYDNLNHLTSVQQTSNGTTNLLLVTYTYDVFGNRVQQAKWKSGGSTVTTRFDYDGQDVWADTDTSNTVQVRYLRGDAVDQVFARTVASGQPNAGVAWYLTDRLGSVRDLMDSTQTLRDHLDYDGFGNTTETTASYGDRYKWTGREYDADTGLQYNRARYYDSKTGRWLSQDPLRFRAGDSNLSRYVVNNPTNYTDPSGADLNDVLRDKYFKDAGIDEGHQFYIDNNGNQFWFFHNKEGDYYFGTYYPKDKANKPEIIGICKYNPGINCPTIYKDRNGNIEKIKWINAKPKTKKDRDDIYAEVQKLIKEKYPRSDGGADQHADILLIFAKYKEKIEKDSQDLYQWPPEGDILSWPKGKPKPMIPPEAPPK
jgi:RHS repeat-associated protein